MISRTRKRNFVLTLMRWQQVNYLLLLYAVRSNDSHICCCLTLKKKMSRNAFEIENSWEKLELLKILTLNFHLQLLKNCRSTFHQLSSFSIKSFIPCEHSSFQFLPLFIFSALSSFAAIIICLRINFMRFSEPFLPFFTSMKVNVDFLNLSRDIFTTFLALSMREVLLRLIKFEEIIL